MRNFDLSPLMRQLIGFDKLANALQNAGESQSFPPYNIEKSDDNHYRITLALAGFRQEAKRREKMAASRAYESAI